MLFHRRQNAEVPLDSVCIVVVDVVFNHLYESFPVCESLPVVAFPLQNSPEALHRAVINAFGYAGHALLHSGFFKHGVKDSIRILVSPVTVKQRMSFRVCCNSSSEGLVDQRIIIMITDYEGYNTPVKQIKNGTEVHLMDDRSIIPFKLRNVRQPLFIGSVCLKFSIQLVLGNILRIRSMPRAAIVGVFDGRLDSFRTADPQHALVADPDLVVFLQIISDPAVSFIWGFGMNFLSEHRNMFIFLLPMALFPA